MKEQLQLADSSLIFLFENLLRVPSSNRQASILPKLINTPLLVVRRPNEGYKKKKREREDNAGMKGASLGEVRTSPSPFRRGERDHAQFRPDKTLALGDN